MSSANDLDSLVVDNLLAGSAQVQTKSITILSGQGKLARGTVLGQIKTGTIPTTGTADGGNTGTGAMSSVAAKRRIKVGTYIMTCNHADTNLGLFDVVDPEGKHIGTAKVGTAFVSDQIGFSIADATDFVVGDFFTVVIPAATTNLDKGVKIAKANIDGSGVATCILAEAIDATSADVKTVGYHTGQFNRAALVYAAANVEADHIADLTALMIRLKDVVAV